MIGCPYLLFTMRYLTCVSVDAGRDRPRVVKGLRDVKTATRGAGRDARSPEAVYGERRPLEQDT